MWTVPACRGQDRSASPGAFDVRGAIDPEGRSMARRLAGLWRNRDFVKLWMAQTISKFGSHVGGSAVGFTAILNLKATPAQMGLLSAMGSAPILVVGLFAGV